MEITNSQIDMLLAMNMEMPGSCFRKGDTVALRCTSTRTWSIKRITSTLWQGLQIPVVGPALATYNTFAEAMTELKNIK